MSEEETAEAEGPSKGLKSFVPLIVKALVGVILVLASSAGGGVVSFMLIS